MESWNQNRRREQTQEATIKSWNPKPIHKTKTPSIHSEKQTTSNQVCNKNVLSNRICMTKGKQVTELAREWKMTAFNASTQTGRERKQKHQTSGRGPGWEAWIRVNMITYKYKHSWTASPSRIATVETTSWWPGLIRQTMTASQKIAQRVQMAEQHKTNGQGRPTSATNSRSESSKRAFQGNEHMNSWEIRKSLP